MVVKFHYREVKGANMPQVIFGNGVFAEIFEEMLEVLRKKKEITSEDLAEVQKRTGHPRRSVYYVVERMAELGMLMRVRGKWIISRQFGNALARMYKWWRKIVEE